MDRLLACVNSSEIPGLNGVRALAAAIVLVSHYAHLPSGNLGVEIFFVLSGFLITTLLLRERSRTGTISLVAFYKRRARRIFPAFYVFWTISVLVLAVKGNLPSRGQLLATFFYFTNYYQSLINPQSGFVLYAWSLAVEEQFYLLWPMLFLSFRRDVRRLAQVTFALAIAVLVWRTSVLAVFGSRAVWYTYNAFECRADQLFIGCLLAISLHQRWFARFFAAICQSHWLVFLTIAGLALSVYLQPGDVQSRMLGGPLEALLAAILLVQVIWFAPRSPLWHWLDSGPMRYGARISYALYLYQGLPYTAVTRLLPDLPSLPTGILSGAGSVLMAHLSYELVEKHFLKASKPGRLRPGATKTAS